MSTGEYDVRYFDHSFEKEWDEFVINFSVNGTFLQSRNFLNYHAPGKFIDASVMVFDKKNHLIAVCPACIKYENGKKVFSSHQGSTYGGIIIAEQSYVAHKTIEIIKGIEKFLRKNGFGKIEYKITSDLLCKRNSDLLRYSLYYCDYVSYEELNLYIDMKTYKEDILANFSQGKRTNVHNCIKEGIVLKKLSSNSEIEKFHALLCDNLKKYEKMPVHSIAELIEFKNFRLQNECEFFGLYLENDLIAGCMMFYFNNVNVAHTQYLCADAEYNKLSPMTYMYYLMIVEARKRGAQKLSWGITTEHYGRELNWGLTKSKEAYGSQYSVSYIYEKELS